MRECDGSGNGPYKTLAAAISAVKSFRDAGVLRPMTISLLDDEYLGSPLEINNIPNLTLESYGKRCRIIGGFKVSGFSADTFMGTPCLSAKVPRKENGETYDFTDLYVNGEVAKATRFPKNGELKLLDTEGEHVNDPSQSKYYSATSKWFDVIPSDLEGIDNITDAIINYYHFWVDEHSPIESYDKQSGRIVMKYRSRFSATCDYDNAFNGAVLYYLTNVPNTFSAPGEWYFDKKTCTLYYIPKDESETADSIDAFIPTLDKLLSVESNDVIFRNVEFTCTKGDYASRMKYDNEKKRFAPCDDESFGSDIQSVCWAPGAIRLKKSERVSFDSCVIGCVGIHGIEISQGCKNIRIENSRIENILAGAIKIEGGGVSSAPEAKTSNCIIRNNHIRACGKRYSAGCAVLVMNASCNEISENEIHDTEYSGISVGWVWGYADSATYGNIIKRNHIYDIGKGNLSDLGGIYTLGKQSGTVISENRIHGIKCKRYGAWGIYLDEGSSYIKVEKNVVYDAGTECFHLHYGSHNTVKNNIFLATGKYCIKTDKEEPHDELIFERNLLITDGIPVFHPTTGVNTIHSASNIIYDISGKPPILMRAADGTEYSLEAWRNKFSLDKGSIVANPNLCDINNHNLTPLATDALSAIGFEPIPEYVTENK